MGLAITRSASMNDFLPAAAHHCFGARTSSLLRTRMVNAALRLTFQEQTAEAEHWPERPLTVRQPHSQL